MCTDEKQWWGQHVPNRRSQPYPLHGENGQCRLAPREREKGDGCLGFTCPTQPEQSQGGPSLCLFHSSAKWGFVKSGLE